MCQEKLENAGVNGVYKQLFQQPNWYFYSQKFIPSIRLE